MYLFFQAERGRRHVPQKLPEETGAISLAYLRRGEQEQPKNLKTQQAPNEQKGVHQA
jgi:hypothetical protein